MKWILKKKRRIVLFVGVVFILLFYAYPPSLFTEEYSTILEARSGELLSAAIAADGQWRFPAGDSIPSKFKTALIAFEDKRFYYHPGVDLLSMARAMRQNLSRGKIVSGASTLTMQVIRLMRHNQSRTFFEKIIEMALATRLELHYSKQQILKLYAAHAPLGGNVVGLEAASWRYFGTDASDLSWAQAAMLAVLPNSPSLMHPGKNRNALFDKRNRLLQKLKDEGVIDEFTLQLSLTEPIPEEPFALPRHARHLLLRMEKDGLGQTKTRSTIDFEIQNKVEQYLDIHHQRLAANQIMNAAALVVDVSTGEVLAYAGNVNQQGYFESEVDIIASPRSTGSILKPFLYAAMMDDGKLLPGMLLPDVPLQINGFAPKNFSRSYDGAVPAGKALIRSLNVPAVHLLREYRYEKFHSLLKNIGMTTLRQPPDHFGLSLILGGAEATLWDITGMYASMARTAKNYFEHPGKNKYQKTDFHQPVYIQPDTLTNDPPYLSQSSFISASSAYVTFETLKDLFRPGEETGWRYFNSSKKIAWKTGTSFGLRDGWAVGVTPDYAVGVWVGNADGEGRPGLTGTDAASPLMFDIFSILPENSWFSKPVGEMSQIIVCSKSGYRASENCDQTDTIWVSNNSLNAGKCFYHKKVHLTKDYKFQIHDQCADLSDMVHVNWFVLPPIEELYFKQVNLSYKSLPPFRKDCASSSMPAMDMVYPKDNARIFVPRELDGSAGRSIFELAHRSASSIVYWHLDGKYIGSTQRFHRIELNPDEGKHVLTAIDSKGEILEKKFEVISKK